MQILKTISTALAVLIIASCGQTTQPGATGNADISGPWSLDADASKIAFTSIKSGELIETHYFPGLSGSISVNGDALVTIPLDEVETKIDQRNERMRSLFFETNNFPTASIRAAVAIDSFSGLAVGARTTAELDGVLTLHGAESTIYADVFVTRIAQTRVEVATSEPVIVHVSDFNLDAGLEALREIANLPSITPAVPVTFTLVFEAADAN